MKKTFRFLSMATLLVVGAIMTGCSNEDNIDNPQQPANNDNVVTLTATVSLDGGAQTRAITPSTGVKTFESGNQIAVIYKNTSNETVKAVSTDFTPTGDNTKATFTVTLTNPASGSAVRYIYPASMAKATIATDATITDDNATIDYTGLLGNQDGKLATIGTNYDLARFDGSLSGTDLPASASLENPLAICKFTLTDGSTGITSNVNSLTISDGTNTYAVSPSGLSEIYVAMKPTTGKIAFTAATGSKTYFKTATGTTLAASTLYTNITVSMVELARGSVICSDGSVYASKDAATSASKTPVAMIAYLGSDNGEAAPYNHGLALAMTDAGGGSYLQWSTSTSDAGHTKQTDSNNFTSESGLQYNATHNSDTYPAFKAAIANNSTAAPTGCSAWFLASGYQWTKMFAGNAGGLKTLAGLESYLYWSSSERNANSAWYFYSDNGYWYNHNKDYDDLVRSCLAF